MKIAYFVENYGKKSETFIRDVVIGLSKKGINGNIYVDRIVNTNEVIPVNFKLIETKFASKYSRLLIYVGFLLNLLRIKYNKQGVKNKISNRVIFSHLYNFKPDLAYIDFGNNAILLRKSLDNLNIPFIVHFHGIDASQYLGNKNYIHEVNKVFKSASKIIVASNHIKRRLVLAGCLDTKIELIKFGIKIDEIPQKKWSLDTKNKSLLFVGRLVEKKNPIALIHSFRLAKLKFPKLQLIIVGEGPLMSTCKKLVDKYNLGKAVDFRGGLEQCEVFELYSQAHIYVQHSVTSSKGDQEGFAISLTEAAASGLPIVSTIHNGITENVVDGETGFLVPEFDYEQMAEKIIYLLENPNVAIQMGINGRERVEKYFKPENRINKIVQLFESIVKNE